MNVNMNICGFKNGVLSISIFVLSDLFLNKVNVVKKLCF